MKRMLMAVVALAVVVAFSPAVYACAGVHGANVASALNDIFGFSVAEGDAQDTNKDGVASGGDHGVTVWDGNGNSMTAQWTSAQALYDWLIEHGVKAKNNGAKGTKFEGELHNG